MNVDACDEKARLLRLNNDLQAEGESVLAESGIDDTLRDEGFQAVGSGGDHIHAGALAQQIAQFLAGQLLVIYDNCREDSRRTLSHGVGIIAFRL